MGIAGEILTFAELELRRLRHDPIEIFTRAIQPILWLTVFGEIMASRIRLPISISYVTYITPGVAMQSAVFIALAYGIMLVWERDSGILKRLLTSPIRRIVIVAGRSLAGAIRASTQLLVIIITAYIIGAGITYDPVSIVLAFIIMIIGGMGFTALSILIASLLKTRERFMGIINAITMPLFFTSNALYPVEIMPLALRIIAMGNPLTYIVDAIRGLLVYDNYTGSTILLDIGVVTLFTVASIIIASIWFRKIIE